MIIGEILHFVQNDNKTAFGMTKYVMLGETKDLERLLPWEKLRVAVMRGFDEFAPHPS